MAFRTWLVIYAQGDVGSPAEAHLAHFVFRDVSPVSAGPLEVSMALARLLEIRPWISARRIHCILPLDTIEHALAVANQLNVPFLRSVHDSGQIKIDLG